MMERVVTLLCAATIGGALFAAAGGQARAAEVTVSLEYVAGPDCPNVDDFKAVVVARLGRDPFKEGAPDHVLVHIVRDGALDGRIEWRDAKGQWIGDQSFPLITIDCGRLVQSMGFALAVQIQLLETASGSPTNNAAAPHDRAAPSVTPAPPPAAPPPPLPLALPANQPQTAPDRMRSTRSPWPVFAIGGGPSIGLGMSSTPILLGRLFGAAAWSRTSIELGGEVSVPTTTRRSDGAGFSQQHLLASAAACARTTRWNVCLLVNAGEVRMAGQNIDRPSSAVAPLVQGGARIGMALPLGRRFLVDAHADGLANVIRWTGALDQVPVWTAPHLAAVIGVDVGARFP